MAYEAVEDIGDYKKGDIVPDEIAEVWDKMYKRSPVKQVEKKNRFIKRANKRVISRRRRILRRTLGN